MGTGHNDVRDREESLDQVLAAYLKAAEAGQAGSRDDWLTRYPELAGELAEFFAGQDRLDDLARPLREAAAACTLRADDVSTGDTGVEAEAPADEPILYSFGNWDVLSVLAQGGMGVVYKARQRNPRRLVALKMIRTGPQAAPADVQRFRNETEVVASLDHPHIVPIYEVGEYEGCLYFSMKFLEGGPLTAQLARFTGDPRAAARLLIAVARAVHHAHQRGVLHRDLKPSNVLLDGEGRPHVTDFGLAKRLEADGSLTEPGALVGTPSYMAPEQAAGRKGAVTTATDVYGLGAVLYALLTGRPPFRADTAVDTLLLVREREPEPPRRVNARVDRDLETICLKCLQKEPPRRYGSAEALAEDLERWLKGEPIAARPVRLPERAWKWVRRRPAVTALLGVSGAALVALVLGMIWHNGQLRQAAAEFAHQRDVADEQRRLAQAAAEAERRAKDRAEKARDRTREALDAMTSSVAGDSLTTQKELSAEQKKFLTEVLKYYQEFAGENADDEQSRARSAEAAHRVGKIQMRLGRAAEAAAAYRMACDGFRRLAADFPAVPEYRERLASCQGNLGALLNDYLGKPREAEAEFRAALAIREKLAADFPALQDHRTELATHHHNLGMALTGLGRRPEAEAEFRSALAIREKLAKEFPAVPEHRERLAHSHNGLAVLLQQWGKPREAEAEYRSAVAVSDKLAADFPAVPEYRLAQSLSHSNLGLLLISSGKRPEAEAEFGAARAIQERLAADFPAVPMYRVLLGGSYNSAGNLAGSSGRLQESLEWQEKAVRTLNAVYEQHPQLSHARGYLGISYGGRAKAYERLGKFAAAVQDYDKAVELCRPQEQPVFRASRALARVHAGQVAEGVAEAAELTKDPSRPADQWYDLACVYSLASGKSADKKQDYADRAMALLHRAVQAGYAKVARLKEDTDLNPIRGRDDFKKLIADLEKPEQAGKGGR